MAVQFILHHVESYPRDSSRPRVANVDALVDDEEVCSLLLSLSEDCYPENNDMSEVIVLFLFCLCLVVFKLFRAKKKIFAPELPVSVKHIFSFGRQNTGRR